MEHHTKELGMKPSTYDPCLLIANKDIFGLVGMQTDDTSILGDIKFSEKKEEKLKFNAKPKKQLSTTNPLVFNGSILSLNEDFSIALIPNGQERKIVLLNLNNENTSAIKFSVASHSLIQKTYVQQRARGAYLASIC